MRKAVNNMPRERKGAPLEKCEQYVDILSEMISCKTVFTSDGKNAEEFDRFYKVIEENFPLLSSRAKRLTFGSGCFVYVIEGTNANKNIMLMSHHDVVDGDDKWNGDPFVPEKKNGYLYGRGTIDTKTPLFAELMACEELLANGYDFDGMNLYIGSSNNEECSGDGMVLAAQYFKDNDIRFYVVLDEGGAITEGMIPGVKCKSAVVAVHEKSRHFYRCSVKSEQAGHGGFGTMAESAAERLSGFITEVKNAKIYKGAFYPEVKATFERHASYMSFPLNILFGHMDIFSPIIKKIMMKIPAASAMLSTSISFQTAFAGDPAEPNSRSKTGEAVMYLRCVREEDLEEGLVKIKEIAEKYGIEIEETLRDFCPPTDFNDRPYRLTEAVLRENFPDIAVAPFLLTAGTDARRLGEVADNILRFAPIDLSKEQFATIHAENEHIGIKNIGECVEFYKDFIQRI